MANSIFPAISDITLFRLIEIVLAPYVAYRVPTLHRATRTRTGYIHTYLRVIVRTHRYRFFTAVPYVTAFGPHLYFRSLSLNFWSTASSGAVGNTKIACDFLSKNKILFLHKPTSYKMVAIQNIYFENL